MQFFHAIISWATPMVVALWAAIWSGLVTLR